MNNAGIKSCPFAFLWNHMESIRINICLSPHIIDGKGRGYYLLAQDLFSNGAPILRRDQFVGFNDRLIVSVARHNPWKSLLHMNIHARMLGGQATVWLDKSKLYAASKGFRMYIPSRILRPSAGGEKVNTFGVLHKQEYGGGVEALFYLEMPTIGAKELLKGRL